MKRILILALLAIAATCAHASSVGLTWKAGMPTSDPATGFNIYRAVQTSGTCGTYSLLVGSINMSTPSWSDSTITAGNTYCYYVTSYDSMGVESDPSNGITVAIPAAPVKPAAPNSLSGSFIQ